MGKESADRCTGDREKQKKKHFQNEIQIYTEILHTFTTNVVGEVSCGHRATWMDSYLIAGLRGYRTVAMFTDFIEVLDPVRVWIIWTAATAHGFCKKKLESVFITTKHFANTLCATVKEVV